VLRREKEREKERVKDNGKEAVTCILLGRDDRNIGWKRINKTYREQPECMAPRNYRM